MKLIYEISAKNQTTYPRILTDSQTTSHSLRIVRLSGFICDLRNLPFRTRGSTVVKIFQTSFNFEPIKTKLYYTMKMTCHLIYNLSH